MLASGEIEGGKTETAPLIDWLLLIISLVTRERWTPSPLNPPVHGTDDDGDGVDHLSQMGFFFLYYLFIYIVIKLSEETG